MSVLNQHGMPGLLLVVVCVDAEPGEIRSTLITGTGYIASLGTMTPSSGANTSPSATLRTLSSGPRSTSISNIIPPSTTMSTATSSANGAPEAPLQANSSYPSAPHGLAHGSKVGIGVGALFGTVALLALGFFLGRFRFGFKLPALRTRTTSRIVQEEAIPSKQTRQDVVELDGIAQARHELSGSAQVATELPLSPPSPAIGPRRDQVPDAAEVPNNEAGRSDIPSEDQLGKYETLTCNEEERKKN
ncbi:MAG: hypothetical protein M1820_005511 [Bogoriella megaspora]|nr:MAG: hypothetical protein M1820_005511 [Bogoriella megaspora]